VVLLVILVVAAALRLYGALVFPFEQDELYTVNEATYLFKTPLLPGIQARPVFFFLEHPIVTYLPHSAIILRTLPLIFGLIGVLLIWVLARRVVGERAAAVAALIAALSPWHLYASGFGRYYSLIFMLATLVYWLLPKAYDSDQPRDYVAVLGALLVGSWTHPSFVFPVAFASLGVMAMRSDGRLGWRWPTVRGWMFLWGPFVALSAIIYAVIRLVHPATTVANGGDRGLGATLRLVPAMVDWMTPTVFVLASIGAITLLRSPEPLRRRFGLMAILGTVGMIVALFSLSFITAIYADYGVAAMPLIFVAAAGFVQAIEEAVPFPRNRGLVYGVVGVVLVGILPSAVSYLSDGTRFDYRPAYGQIVRTAPDLPVLTTPIILQREYAPQLRAYDLPRRRAKLDTLLARERNLWAVISVKRYGIMGDDRGEIAEWLADRCRPAGTHQRPRLDYRVYRVDLWRCSADI
jgi:hypothetical protein